MAKYKRVLLKLSGEALSGADGILNFDFIADIARVVKRCVDEGSEIAVMCGAGNIWRGRQGGTMDRVRADSMGMLATVINSLAIQDTFLSEGIDAVVLTAVDMQAFADPYSPRKADEALSSGKVVILGCGSGLPYFSTDTAAVLRAAEIRADIVLMAKNVDGVYSADPGKNPGAVRLDSISYAEVIEKDLHALDMTATVFCMENHLRSYVFGLKDPENIYRVIRGEKIGTELHN